MAKTSPDETWRTVVAGDVSVDWNLARSPGPEGATIGVSCQAGEAALLGKLIAAVAGEVSNGPGAAIKVLAPEAPPGTTPADERFHHRHAIWTSHADGGRQVWRVEEFLGVDRAAAGAGAVPVKDDPEGPNLVVLHDVGLGFRDQPELWPRCVRESADTAVDRASDGQACRPGCALATAPGVCRPGDHRGAHRRLAAR